MLTYKIHLIRHGLTQANLEGRYIGATDLPLCPEGLAGLRRLQAECDYPPVDRVYTSPLLRARQTADLLFPDRQVVEEPDLRELAFGVFENRTGAELDGDPAFRRWLSDPSARPPGGESAAELAARVEGALAHIFAEMMRERLPSVAVVTHGGVIACLLAAMGLPQREPARWNAGPGEGYTLLLSTQMWMRDHKFEVYGALPWPREPAGEAPGWEWV